MEGFLSSSKRENPTFKRNLAIIAAIGVIGLIGAFAYLQSSRISPSLLDQYQSEESEFQEFIQKYNKEYTPEEYEIRFQIFQDNLAFIRVQNSLNRDWVLGVNEFADLTMEEFRKYYLSPMQFSDHPEYSSSESLKLPTSVDWRQQGAVTVVQNQGRCSCAYAFATTGAVEGAWKIFNGTLVQLSEQEIIDCSRNFGNRGCEGGTTDGAYKYMIKNGITSETKYPFMAQNGLCKISLVSESVAEIANFTDIYPNDTVAVETAVAQQPVSANVQADEAIWKYYKGGVITSNCGTNLDHSVLIVGYNLTSTPNYW
eukprot:CAMPEP_0202946166 /NCGR_PEP_ID=MMETSP1395-20130829/8792_1 /ASSEMBLY_ACC=CAM_ASM_000871 /TAXON_ID=5961 /ORGANISM="Blepharisma japonicum, Strain Stock R1072" /LENGTH=312 /DNA_ID=CAMNT_0049646609 /DNA_START=28 /DNA_END=963 /DNA_ORIENTATION=-